MSARNRSVRIPALAEQLRGTRLVEVRDLYRVAKTILDRTLWSGNLEEILRRTPIYEGDTIVDWQLQHELRFKKVPVSESGTVGKQTLAQLVGTMTVQIEHARQELVDEQPGCAWRLVAAVVEQIDVSTSERIARQGSAGGVPNARATLADLTGDEEYVPPSAMNQRHDNQVASHHKCVVYMVWADIGQGALIDPAGSHAETEAGRNGPMARYRASRMLSHLSNSGQQMRERAEDLVREFMVTAGDDDVGVPVDEPEIPDSPAIEDAVTVRVRVLAEQGHAAGRIARELGLPSSTVLERLKLIGHEPPPRPAPKPRGPPKPRKPKTDTAEGGR